MTPARKIGLWTSLTLALLPCVATAAPIGESYSVLADLDANPTTGCDVSTSEGTVQGVERLLVTTVFGSQVTDLVVRDCDAGAGVFGPPLPVGGLALPWPVGAGGGVAGSDVIESFLPFAGAPPRAVRLGFTSTTLGGEDAILESSGALFLLSVDPGRDIPTASTAALLGLALLLVWAALSRLRAGGAISGFLLLLVSLGLFAAGAEAAGTIVLDGDPSDWPGTADLVAPDPAGDGGTDVDLRSGLAAVDLSAPGLWIRFDAARNEPPSITTDPSVSIPEGQLSVVDVEASDPEGETEGAGLSYALSGGADQALFGLDPGSGVLAFLAAPDRENPGDTNVDNAYEVAVTVSDSRGLTAEVLFTVQVADVNEPPVATDTMLGIDENAAANTVVGVVPASDPDQDAPFASLGYAITGGNTGNAFTIDASGTLRVATPTALDFETNPTFVLTVTVSDGGSPSLSDDATITVDLNDLPELSFSPPAPFCSYANPPGCLSSLGVGFDLNGACSGAGWTITVLFDQGADGSTDLDVSGQVTGTQPSFTIGGSYPLGSHRFEVQAVDACANTLTASIPFEVVDCKAPTPICTNGLAIELAAGGTFVVYATDFVASPVNDCSAPVTYSINPSGGTPDVNDTSLTLTCSDRPSALVEIHGWDAVGNQDFCETYVLVQDNMTSCP